MQAPQTAAQERLLVAAEAGDLPGVEEALGLPRGASAVVSGASSGAVADASPRSSGGGDRKHQTTADLGEELRECQRRYRTQWTGYRPRLATLYAQFDPDAKASLVRCTSGTEA